MTIQELLSTAAKHGCNVGIIAVVNDLEPDCVELRISKNGNHFSRRISSVDITQNSIDVVAIEFNFMLQRLDD